MSAALTYCASEELVEGKKVSFVADGAVITFGLGDMLLKVILESSL
jgi:hypothetical protein